MSPRSVPDETNVQKQQRHPLYKGKMPGVCVSSRGWVDICRYVIMLGQLNAPSTIY